jgi:hypothetical protein
MSFRAFSESRGELLLGEASFSRRALALAAEDLGSEAVGSEAVGSEEIGKSGIFAFRTNAVKMDSRNVLCLPSESKLVRKFLNSVHLATSEVEG